MTISSNRLVSDSLESASKSISHIDEIHHNTACMLSLVVNSKYKTGLPIKFGISQALQGIKQLRALTETHFIPSDNELVNDHFSAFEDASVLKRADTLLSLALEKIDEDGEFDQNYDVSDLVAITEDLIAKSSFDSLAPQIN